MVTGLMTSPISLMQKPFPKNSIDKIKGTKVLVVNALQRSTHISHFNLEQAIAFATGN